MYSLIVSAWTVSPCASGGRGTSIGGSASSGEAASDAASEPTFPQAPTSANVPTNTPSSFSERATW